MQDDACNAGQGERQHIILNSGTEFLQLLVLLTVHILTRGKAGARFEYLSVIWLDSRCKSTSYSDSCALVLYTTSTEWSCFRRLQNMPDIIYDGTRSESLMGLLTPEPR